MRLRYQEYIEDLFDKKRIKAMGKRRLVLWEMQQKLHSIVITVRLEFDSFG